VLQCVAEIGQRTSTDMTQKCALQCVATCYRILQCVAVCCSVLLCVAVCCSVLQCVAVCCNVLQCGAKFARVPAPQPNLRPVYTPIIVAPCPSGASDLSS